MLLQGNSGTVVQSPRGPKFVIKSYDGPATQGCRCRSLATAQEEWRILKEIQEKYPRTQRSKSPMHEYCAPPCVIGPVKQSENGVSLVEMEKKQGSALIEWVTHNIIDQEIEVSPTSMLEFFLRLTRQLAILHDHVKVSHCDLRCENVMVDGSIMDVQSAKVSIIDFADASHQKYIEGGRSFGYPSPEHTEPLIDTKAFDIWCLGCVFYIAVFGYFPLPEFSPDHRKGQSYDITSSRMLVPLERSHDKECHTFLRWLQHHLLCDDPSMRLTASQAENLLRESKDSREFLFINAHDDDDAPPEVKKRRKGLFGRLYAAITSKRGRRKSI